MTSYFERLRAAIWSADPNRLSPLRRHALRAARLALCVVRDLAAEQLDLRAMSLVYTTLMSLVPLLALSFSVLKGFGVHNQLEPLLLGYLAPLGPKGVEIAEEIVGFVENINVAVLGAVGLGVLVYTVISLLQKIESAFNFVWRVRQARTLSERFSRFLSVLLIGPVLVFSAIGLTATAMSHTMVQRLIAIEPFGTLFLSIGKLLPYALVIGALTFLYVFIPNTRVRLLPALVGGTLAGLAWQSAGWAFASFIASSTRYAAIYAGFAIVILLFIWLYLSWLIVLVGAQIAFYVQNSAYLDGPISPDDLNDSDREAVSLGVLGVVVDRFEDGTAPVLAGEVARTLGLPIDLIDRSLRALVAAGILAEVSGAEPSYLFAIDPSTVTLAEVVRRLRSESPGRILMSRLPGAAAEALQRLDICIDETLAAITVKELGHRTSTRAIPAAGGNKAQAE